MYSIVCSVTVKVFALVFKAALQFAQAVSVLSLRLIRAREFSLSGPTNGWPA